MLEEWRKILIEEVKKIRINDYILTWIRTYIRSPSMTSSLSSIILLLINLVRDDEEILYLNRYTPAKEKPGACRKR